MSRIVLFPPTKEAQALAYQAKSDEVYAATYEPGGIFSYITPDAFGNWAVPYYGPDWTFDGTPFEEPAEMIPYRIDGVIVKFATWPGEEVPPVNPTDP